MLGKKRADPLEEAVCGGCLRLVFVASGRPVPGWERARFVSGTDVLCSDCKAPIIDGMARQLAEAIR